MYVQTVVQQRMPPPFFIRSLLHLLAFLALLLLVAFLPGAATGKNVISVVSASSGSHHYQLHLPTLLRKKSNAIKEDSNIKEDAVEVIAQQKPMEDKSYKDFDFSAYDFNVQAEASIPEDIFDQLYGDLKVETTSQLPYAVSANNDTNESDAADIILESQIPTLKHFSFYLAKDDKPLKNKYNSNSSSNNNLKTMSSYNISHYYYNLKNNKDSMLKRVDNEETASATKLTSGDANNNYKVSYDNNDKTKSEDESGNRSKDNEKDAKPKEFKIMHEQQNQQSQVAIQQQTNASGSGQQMTLHWNEARVQQQRKPQQLFHSTEILNERKFNKTSSQSALQLSNNVVGDHKLAIGDIEDNFGNDDVLADNNDESTTMVTTAPASTTAASLTTAQTTTTASQVAAVVVVAISSSYQVLPISQKKKHHGNANNPALDKTSKSQVNDLVSYFDKTIRTAKQQRQRQEDNGFFGDEYSLLKPKDTTSESTSTFERFKALRRSNHQNGHKGHKKRFKNYLKLKSTLSHTRASKLRKNRNHREVEWNTEQDRNFGIGLPHEELHTHVAPIFALGVRPQHATASPFYEGQVNYYDHEDEDQLGNHRTDIKRHIAADKGTLYRRISPGLRNDVKSSKQQQHQHLENHHHLNHHYHHKHTRQRPPNSYQRKLSSPSTVTTSNSPASLSPRKQKIGLQITELEQLERYYAKWPHLARVQFQVYDEHYSESHSELNVDNDADEDYESAAELEEAQKDHSEGANLPPYIKKYNRRNKQLLNLLEGTLPPPMTSGFAELRGSSKIQPSSYEVVPIHLDDEYVKQKRRRYQQHHEDLFALQRRKSSYSTTVVTTATLTNTSTGLPNDLPEEGKQLDKLQLSTTSDRFSIEKSAAQLAKLHATPKPAFFKLPLYPIISSSFLGTPCSRSAQLGSNVSGRKQTNWYVSAGLGTDFHSAAVDDGTLNSTMAQPPSPLNSFVYHRVIDGGGASSFPFSASTGMQRLPFVAITDRRLDTVNSKKLLTERHKDFKQNHFPKS